MRPLEQTMGDKAYVGEPAELLAPWKKPAGGELDEERRDMNALHSWFRGGFEHVIAQIKRFNILGLKFAASCSQMVAHSCSRSTASCAASSRCRYDSGLCVYTILCSVRMRSRQL